MSSPQNQHIWVKSRGTVHGPFDLERVERAIQRGQLSSFDIASEDRKSWEPLSRLVQRLQFGEAAVPPARQHSANTTEAVAPLIASNPEGAPSIPPASLEDFVGAEAMSGFAAQDSDAVERQTEWTDPQTDAWGQSPPNSTPLGHDDAKYCSECGSQIRRRCEICPVCGCRVAPSHGTMAEHRIGSKSRLAFALLAIFLGGLGIHRFYLGQAVGIFYLLFVWTGIPALVGFVEGLYWLCQTDRRFATWIGDS